MKNIKKGILLLSLTFALSFSLIACSTEKNDVKDAEQVVEKFQPEVTKYPLTIKDSYGREVTLDEEPGGIISASPNITEIIYEINRGGKLIGRTEADDFPDIVTGIDSIGELDNLDLKEIKTLAPTLVLASENLTEEQAEKLEKEGIKVLVFSEDKGFAGTYKTIENVGVAINAQQEAFDLIESMNKTVDEVKDAVKDLDKKKTYYVAGFENKEALTVDKDSLANHIIEMAGGENITGNDKLVKENPDVIFFSRQAGDKKDFMADEKYKDLTAVKEDKVYEIDENTISRQGPRLSEGLLEVMNILHSK